MAISVRFQLITSLTDPTYTLALTHFLVERTVSVLTPPKQEAY